MSTTRSLALPLDKDVRLQYFHGDVCSRIRKRGDVNAMATMGETAYQTLQITSRKEIICRDRQNERPLCNALHSAAGLAAIRAL